MKRKILACLISAVLVIMTVVPAFVVANAAVWSGSYTVPMISGGVYQIASGENLAWFANAVNNGNVSIKGKLTADIQLNYTGSTANEWVPIGNENSPFKGSLDGNGHTISGLYVDSDSYGVGLFGYAVYPDETTEPEDVSPEYTVGTKTYNIKDITVINSSVSGRQNVGGIIGYSYNAGIIDCSYSGSVTSSENSAGGIVGYANGSTVVSQCVSGGTVAGHQRVGGTVGYNTGNSVVTKCYGDADVSGYWNVGGLVGTLSSASILGGFFLGTVSADDRAGGLVGYSAFGNMVGAYTISSVTNTGTGTTDFGGAVGVIYSGTYSSVFYSYEDSGVDGPVGIGRTRIEMTLSDFVKEVNHTTPFFCFDYTNINSGYPVLTWMLAPDVWAGDQSMPQKNSSGTYLISKPSELAWFAGLVNGTLSGITQNAAANATVTADLLFNIDVNDDTMGRNEWTPIGTSASPYTGTFNGGGYNLAGIYVSPETGTNAGLFGYLGAGSVTGAVVIDGLICGRENVGGIAGYVFGGSITNCVCDSEIQGDRAVGGIAGNLGSSASTVSACAMIGSINGTNLSEDQSFLQNVGGVVGYNNRATVTKSFASINLNAPLARYVGGVVGNNSSGSVTSCYSTSTVRGFDRVGGIIGNNANGTVTKCYTAGKVTGTSQLGMAFGATSGSGVSNCYFDESFKSLANTVTGATSKTPTQMTGSYSVSNLYLGSDFSPKADDTYFYYYPQVYSMAYSSINALKNASLESVKRVQNKYVARVEIDGRTDTYYETIEDAFDYASNTHSSVLPTVFLVRDFELANTLNISSTVGFFGENGAVLSRADTLTGAMINVTGDLTIGSLLYGDDKDTDFYIDGNNVAGTTSAIVVGGGATLRAEEGVCVMNCRTATSSVRGAAVNSVNSTVTVNGGIFDTCISKTVGGAIYSENGEVTIKGGTFRACEASQGSALYNNNGIANISGGMFTQNIASQYGGAIAAYGVYSETTVSGKAVITENQATYGGALAVQNYGTLTIGGGTITANHGYSQGGALYIGSGAEAVISGGTIKDNYAQNPGNPSATVYGNGVYNGGDLSLRGDAQLDPNNDIYLAAGKYVTIPDRLTCSGHAATITPSAYTEGLKVLTGTGVGSFYTKFNVSNTMWHILANGKLTNKDSSTVAIVSKNNAYSVEFVTLYDAFASIIDGDTANITVVADSFITDTIPVHGDVTLSCDETTCVSTRSGSFKGVMFEVYPNAVLRFGDETVNSAQQAQSDYSSGTETAGQMIIDGGYLSTGVTGAAVVNVQTNGEFYMYDDAIIRNCRNTTTSPVTVSGTMHMYGGTICNNISTYGGAIYVKNTGKLNTYGGVIAGNTSTNGGKAIYSLGRVTRNIHSYEFYYIETLYDGEDVIGMADPVYETTVKTDILLADGDEVYLNTNLIYVGETTSSIYVRNLETLPEESEFTLNNMTVNPKTYTVGSVVVTGTNVASYCTGFSTYVFGYCIQSNGKLGVNKLILKNTSSYSADRTKGIVSGLNVGTTTVSDVINQFSNTSTLVRVINTRGASMRNNNYPTTGCKVRLVDNANNIVDELTIIVYGDLNADLKIDGQDAVLVNAVAGGMLNSSNTSAAVLEAGDVNFDGSVTGIDADSVAQCGVLDGTIEQTM